MNHLSIRVSRLFLTFWALVGLSIVASADESCLLNAFENAAPDTTVAELKQQCGVTVIAVKDLGQQSNIQRRIRAERQANDRDYTITPHRPNYVLPVTYNDNPNEAPFLPIDPNASVDSTEAHLQVSIKFPIAQNLWGTDTDLMLAYTNRAWWQVYNDDFSKPFRETNYEPEIFLRHFGGPSVLGLDVAGWDIGYAHQSNGRSEVLSRSWDRIVGQVFADITQDLAVSLKAWYRLPEDDEDDENPHMHRYLGYGEARFIYAPNKNTFTAMYRPGTQKQSFELTWSYPITEHVRIYAQYFNGYGESLLDYDVRAERWGIGFAINDYLQRRAN
ncbi:MAG: phospholipase A [Gammaproteobacteria bacterium]|nr:phospholipase A [Gammaproteobacteria bacterium]